MNFAAAQRQPRRPRAYGHLFICLARHVPSQENGSEVGPDMQREVQALKQLLRTRLGWEYDMRVLDDLEDEDEEDDMPVIVDTSEPYAF
jgi:hypothetical protein